MLRNRVVTALILAPIVVAAIFLLPPLGFAAFFAAIAALAIYEWAGLFGAVKVWQRLLYVLLFASLAATLANFTEQFELILVVGCGLWLAASLAVLVFPSGQAVFRQPIVLAPLGLLIGLVAWVGLLVVHNHEQGGVWLLWMFVLCWAADIGAYFAGRQYGQRRLAAAVSPGKTWEGALGGFLLAILVCGMTVIWWQGQPLYWLAVTGLLIATSVFGDLFESLVKRANGVKDSGTMLPGHGGMLDRIDSILAVSPVLAIILL